RNDFMERNDIMMLNNIVYRLYDSDNFFLTRKKLLSQLQLLIPFSYGSILLSDLDPFRPHLTDPVCLPEEFVNVEEKYIKIAGKDHTQWTMESGYAIVMCESKVLPDHKRLSTPIYQECYRQYNIYDTLQVNIAYNNTFLGVLTLYRTRQNGTFSEDDVSYMRMIGYHLNRLFYRTMVPSTTADRKTDRVDLLKEQYLLTRREGEILSLLLDGQPETDISEKLSIASATLKKHMQHIYRKLGISTRWELLRFKT
ncbi:MAG: helix-turn-helix transcriptional regulator, partial [Lachnospiraceae bacterium]|nr:helix-turn-helix transcriptional regulator [Lachnospiraceae bacterium]